MVNNPNITQQQIDNGELKRTGTASSPIKENIPNYDKLNKQISPLTSSYFNQETIGKTKRAVDNMGFALNDITNSPFNGKTTKLNQTSGLIESTSKELAKLFKTPEEFNQAYNTNQTFKDAIDRFQKAGGKPDTVTSSIVPPMALPEQGVQTTSDYLANIKNPNANQDAQQNAINELIPEREVDQAEIARIGRIPDELRKHYMGDEQTIGLLAQREAEAKEEAKIAEREEKNEKASLKARAEFTIKKNEAEVKIQSAKIEQNRLAAKNYMTGYLAKLGALNTTGAAGLAIQTLDTEYEMNRNELETTAKYATQEIRLNLTTDINNVETDTDKAILKIQQDLTKTTDEVFKEVSKAQQASDKEVYNITAGYSKTLRERTAKYTQDITDAAEKYAKEFAKKAASKALKGIPVSAFTAAGAPTSKNKIVSTIEQKLEAARGADTYVNSVVYAQALKDWITKGGTTKSFKAAFPPVNYANPADTSLPANLRYAKESQTIPKDTDEDDEWSTQ